MAEPQTLAQGHPTEVWASLVGAITIIGVLVTTLWTRQNNDIKSHDEKLEKGTKAFVEIGQALVKIGEQILALEKADTQNVEAITSLTIAIKQLHDQVLVLETEHEPCQEFLKELKRAK